MPTDRGTVPRSRRVRQAVVRRRGLDEVGHAMSILHVLSAHGGALRREQLLALGVSRSELARALSSGTVVRPYRGCYAIPGSERPRVLAQVFRAELACLTACAEHGLPLLTRPSRIHLAVERERSMGRQGTRPVEEVHVHSSTRAVRGRLLAPVAVAIDETSACVDSLAQLVLVDAAMQRGMMTASEIDDFSVTSLARRRGLAARCDGRAESLLETVARVRLCRSRLSVEPQVVIPGVGRVDLLVEGHVVVELDGREYHATEKAFEQDRRRDRLLQLRGLRIARFTYRDVLDVSSDLERTVRALARVDDPSAA